MSLQVLITVGPNGLCHMHGLSQHIATTCEEAMKLHSLGKARQQIVWTRCNNRASESHVTFTIALSKHVPASEVILRYVGKPVKVKTVGGGGWGVFLGSTHKWAYGVGVGLGVGVGYWGLMRKQVCVPNSLTLSLPKANLTKLRKLLNPEPNET